MQQTATYFSEKGCDEAIKAAKESFLVMEPCSHPLLNDLIRLGLDE